MFLLWGLLSCGILLCGKHLEPLIYFEK
jgi:hypothetical protein